MSEERCPHCGSKVPLVRDAFCVTCGEPLDEPPEVPRPAHEQEASRSGRQQHAPATVGPYDLRPEERGYFVGWVVFVIAGVYFACRGLAEGRSLFIVGGSAAILLGASQAAVIAVSRLRPWRTAVGVIWTVLIIVGFVIFFAADFLGRPLFR